MRASGKESGTPAHDGPRSYHIPAARLRTTHRPRDACASAECVVLAEEAGSRRLFSPSTELPSWLAHRHPTLITLDDIPLFTALRNPLPFLPCFQPIPVLAGIAGKTPRVAEGGNANLAP